ncbi:hypothetical protein C0992_005222 [Termitomyces sp. T32_za158]|nr:hypothetical protein C0992_005222 [Termitomyces sp. T32_za158]
MVSPPRQVVIDDSDSQIRYVGSGWFPDQGSHDNVGNYGPTYQKTSHWTNGKDSFSFSFVGSSVAVWGTKGKESAMPKWECFVDGINIGNWPSLFLENNQLLCQQVTMSDGPHTITVNVTSAGNTFWLDYIAFTPSPASSHTPAVLRAQNTDSAIGYGAGWADLNGDANMTSMIGSKANFSFVGTSLTWVGYIPHLQPHNGSFASYSIDNGPSTKFNLRGLSAAANATIYNEAFFTTPPLDFGPHTITVTYEGSNAGSTSTPLTLDYLLINNASLPMTANTSVTTSASAITSSPLPTSSAATTSPMPRSSTPIGPIVGGVVGGLAAIAILLFIFWWWLRRCALHIKSGKGFLKKIMPSIQRLQAEPFTLSSPIAGGIQPPPNVYSKSHMSYAQRSTSLPQTNEIVEDNPPMYTAV